MSKNPKLRKTIYEPIQFHNVSMSVQWPLKITGNIFLSPKRHSYISIFWRYANPDSRIFLLSLLFVSIRFSKYNKACWMEQGFATKNLIIGCWSLRCYRNRGDNPNPTLGGGRSKANREPVRDNREPAQYFYGLELALAARYLSFFILL